VLNDLVLALLSSQQVISSSPELRFRVLFERIFLLLSVIRRSSVKSYRLSE
jgi:hypothetical protein